MEKSKPNQPSSPLSQSPLTQQPRPKLGERPREAVADDGGWHAYRKWLAAESARVRRAEPSASVYSWRGYQSWADKIRRSWDNEK